MLFHINRPDSVTCLRGQHSSDILGLQWSSGGVAGVGCVLASWDASGVVVLWGCSSINSTSSFCPIATFNIPEIATLVWARNEDAVLWSCAAATTPSAEAAACGDPDASTPAASASTSHGGALMQCARCVHTLLCCITVSGEAVLIGDDGWASDCSRYVQLQRVRLWSFHRASAVVASVIPVPTSSISNTTAISHFAAMSGEGLQELCNFSICCSIGTTLLHHRLTVACSWGGQRASVSAVARVVAACSLCPPPIPPSSTPVGVCAAATDANDFDLAAAPNNCDAAVFDGGSDGLQGSAEVLSLLLSPCCTELLVSVRRRDSSVYLLRFVGGIGAKAAHSFALASSRLIIRNDSGSSLVVLPIMGQSGGIMLRHARGLSIVSRDLVRNMATGALPLPALRIAAASGSSEDESCVASSAVGHFGSGSACVSPGGFLVILTTSSASCAVLSALHCATANPIAAVLRYCIGASFARTRSLADAMIAFSTLVALLPKVLLVHKISDWIIVLARDIGSLSRDKEVQRIVQGHMTHMMCMCDFFSMKSRQHVNPMLCQRMEFILSGWKDAVMSLSQAAPDAAQHPSARAWPAGSAREWLLMMMMRLVAMHHVLRYMATCLEANFPDFSRETADGQQRIAKLQQCYQSLKNMKVVPSKDILSILTTFAPIISELAALHVESLSDAINHPALAILHRDVGELLVGARDLAAKSNAQSPPPTPLVAELKMLIQRKLFARPSTSLALHASAQAVAATTVGAGISSTAGGDALAAAAGPAPMAPDGVSRNMPSPPPPSAAATAGSGMRDDSTEFASACLR
jgi:hypothetical protein